MPIEVIAIDKIDLEIDEHKKELMFKFLTNKGKCEILFWVNKPGRYQYQIVLNHQDVIDTFQEGKPINEIGKNKVCKLHKRIKNKLEIENIIPFPDEKATPSDKYDNLMQNIHLASREIDPRLIHSWEKDKYQFDNPSWFESINEVDYFDDKIKAEALAMLENNNIIEDFYETLKLRAVGQKSKSILAFLIALSSILPEEKPIHSEVIGNPGKSKSTITDAVFDIFPKHRKIEFNKNTTPAGLMRMTEYKEGSHILARKPIKIGDFGDSKEQENAQELISMFKELMSEGKYTKILVDTTDEDNLAMVSTNTTR